jgi:dTDP-N-acetylfucosamine:lipid II N-acetylfucosaminyltransferase
MNLHIAPDNSFTNKFVENIVDAGLSGNNKIVVRSNDSKLKAIKSDIASAPLYSSAFSNHVGDTLAYNKVFIHYFTPLLYRWVATNKFQELNWMVWGGDLYNLSALDHTSYEPLTLARFIKKNRSIHNRLYDFKVWATQSRFRKRAYSKVKNVLTWMREEYNFVLANLPVQADHKFFFYENEMPYHELDSFILQPRRSHTLTLVIGNSGSPTNNHLDAVEFLQKHQIRANLLLPVSYGDPHYISFLKQNLNFSYGEIRFMDRYMPFQEYVGWLASSDGLVMNSLRPQGYGNIFMMMYLGKPVYFNKNNISLPDLQKAGLKWKVLDELKSPGPSTFLENKEAVKKLLSHERLMQEYRKLFS